MNKNEEKTLQCTDNVGVQLHAIDINTKQPKVLSNPIILTILYSTILKLAPIPFEQINETWNQINELKTSAKSIF